MYLVGVAEDAPGPGVGGVGHVLDVLRGPEEALLVQPPVLVDHHHQPVLGDELRGGGNEVGLHP